MAFHTLRLSARIVFSLPPAPEPQMRSRRCLGRSDESW